MPRLSAVFVPCEPVCCDDFVIVTVVARDHVIVDFPCGTEWVYGKKHFLACYRPAEFGRDAPAIDRVTAQYGLEM